MTANFNNNEIFWRGIAGEGERQALSVPLREGVLLLVDSTGNRKQLAKQLEPHYRVLSPDDIAEDEPVLQDVNGASLFDLAIVDLAGMARWRHILIEARSRAQPVFLPAMLVASRKDLPRALKVCEAHIDEFLLIPLDPSELLQRVGLLLRARRQALSQSQRLAYLTSHDQGSGLPNKTLFLDRLSQAIQDGTFLRRQVFVLVIQVSLAAVLKSLGNRAMESAGLACSRRLEELLYDYASLARLSHEQWALMLRPGASAEDALEAFRKIQELSLSPLCVSDERIHVSPNVGIAIYPDDATDAHSLLDCAGAALTRTEQISGPSFYSRNMQRQALAHIRTEAGLHEALAKKQFELWFQPKVSLKDRSMVSVEALIRWRLPSGDLVPPNNFIPVAESTGLIVQIDRWVLGKACEYMRIWQGAGGPAQVAVNVSAQNLEEADFVETVKQTLAQAGVDPSLIELELTETALADLGTKNLEKLLELRKLGLSIALDDFGTGYCSLSYLHKLPITTLKIDKSFIDNIATDTSDASITQTIVSLARNFKLNLVAEGIETEAQLTCLADLEVETGQGYIFARPMPFEETQQWIEMTRARGNMPHDTADKISGK